jgi:transcriptional regulator with XRE-family HTH domain
MTTKSQVIRPFGARIRSERRRLGMSQAEFAAEGGVSKTTQIAYESGAHIPDLSYLMGVSERGADATFILTGKYGPSYAGLTLNWDLMQELAQVVEECALECTRTLPVNVKISALRLLYSQFSVDGVIDRKIVRETLALAA